MQKRFACIALVILVLPLFTLGQTPRVSFEVASIRPNISGRTSMGWPVGTRFSATRVTVSDLLLFAYSPTTGPTLQKDFILGGPGWLDSDTFDIEAKSESAEGRETMQLMMRSLLEDRFHLKLHVETRELPFYNLVVVKDGLGIKLSEDQTPPNSQPAPSDAATAGNARNPLPRGFSRMSFDSSGRTLESAAVPLSSLVSILQGQAGRPVIDKTNLKGLVDFRLQFSPNVLEVNAPELQQRTYPSLFSALQGQLGLKLEGAKGPIEVLVIDHVEKPSEN